MGVYYLVDFENVHNDGLNGINTLSKNDHVHIFSTENSPNIGCEIAFSKKVEVKGHIVSAGKQSLDMHLISYLGLLMGVYGKNSSYVIISNDTDYDKVIKFWKEEGYPNVSRKNKIPGSQLQIPNKNTQQNNTVNPNRKLSGDEKSKLNVYVQHNLRSIGYIPEVANKMCSIVVSHCNDPQMMNAIANDLKSTYSCHKAMYEDVKKMLEKYFKTNNLLSKPTTPNTSKREMEIRSFFGQHFKKQTYTKNKEKIIELILNAKSKSEINNGLQKLYSDNNVVKHINTEIKPLIKGLPGK